MCQNSLILTLDAESHKNWPYKHLIDKTRSFRPRIKREGKHISTHYQRGNIPYNLYYRQPWLIHELLYPG